MKDLDSLGGRIRYARESHPEKFTQEQMADHLGMGSKEAYGHYERNRNEMSIETLKRIAEKLSVRLEWLAYGTGPMKADPKQEKLLKLWGKRSAEAQDAFLTLLASGNGT